MKLGIQTVKARVWQFLERHRRPPDFFLARCRGVIHVGANEGQERELYAAHGLNVAWVEPIPQVFARLQSAIAPYPNQRAFPYLVTDVEDREYTLHLSNNEGCSSSIFDLGRHKELWPEIHYTDTIQLRSVTLDTLAEKERLDLAQYDALVLDTQGSELLVLKGAARVLTRMKYVKSEVADFEAYAGCCRLADLEAFFKPRGFRRVLKKKFAGKRGVGAYFEAVYAAPPRRVP